MCTREIMVGTIFAGGRVSSFHLTAYSVRRPRPRPLLEVNSLVPASGRVEQASQPRSEVRRAAGVATPSGSLVFLHLLQVFANFGIRIIAGFYFFASSGPNCLR